MTTARTLECTDLTLAYGHHTVVPQLSLTIPEGRISAIIGSNGCGKSTLLRALSRLLPPQAGTVLLDGQPLARWQPKQAARVIGLLPQGPTAPEGIAVADLVGRGRAPHQRAFARWSTRDSEAVAEALSLTGISDLAERGVDELSGGQRQRVWIAMALAQQTDILLLDEPTTFLDIAHQVDVLDLLADLNRTRSTTIVMVLHDMNMAARYAHHIIAMRSGRIVTQGPPREVMTPSVIASVFDLPCSVIDDPVSGAPMVLPHSRLTQPAPALLVGGNPNPQEVAAHVA